METRALIARTFKDIETYGEDKEIMFSLMNSSGVEPLLFVWDYYFKGNEPDDYKKYCIGLHKTTLGKFTEKFQQIRLCLPYGIQKNLDMNDYINDELYQLYVKNYDKFIQDKKENKLGISERGWITKEKFTNNPDRYREIIEDFVSIKGYNVSDIECCKQDIRIFGSEYIVNAYVECNDEKANYHDWTLDDQGDPYNSKSSRRPNENEYVERLTLGSLLEILTKQNNGEYESVKKAGKVLKFPSSIV